MTAPPVATPHLVIQVHEATRTLKLDMQELCNRPEVRIVLEIEGALHRLEVDTANASSSRSHVVAGGNIGFNFGGSLSTFFNGGRNNTTIASSGTSTAQVEVRCDEVGSVHTSSGNVTTRGAGSVSTMSGDVQCTGAVSGNVSTMSGAVRCGAIAGNVMSMSGSVSRH